MEDKGNPLVSVIIPFYNAPRLKIAIQSIRNQTYQDFELILVNNASDDKSLAVAERFASQDTRVRLITEEKRGVVWAMNKGIEESNGDFIVRMDADDYSFPQRIALQLEAFQKDSTLALVSGLVEYDGEEKNEGFKLYVDWMNDIINENEIKISQFIEFPIANPSIMIKRSLYSEVGLYEDGDFPEDYEFFLRLQARGVNMRKVTQNVIKWHDSSSRLTRTDPRYSTESFYRIKAKYLANWLEEYNPFYPEIVVWGAGRVSRRRSDYLLEYGIQIVQYIDVKKQPGIVHYKEIPVENTCFIVSFVANRGAREEIRTYLLSKNYREGLHFILAS